MPLDPAQAASAVAESAPTAAMRPSRTRYWVIVFAVTLAVIQYIDRICISKAEPFITADLHLSASQMGWVFSAFTLAYALFEIPTGYLGDKIGARRVLMRVVLWWSFFTAATGWVWNWTSLVITRFLFGAGEAGCFPNLTKAFNRWLPFHDRTRAQGIMWMSARWGGALTPLLVFWCLQVMNWRTSFMVFGSLGLVWALIFFLWYRDDPRQHPRVNAAEAALLPQDMGHSEHVNVPWQRLYTSRTVWCLCAQYFAASYSWYFFITWFPKYLKDARGFNISAESALLAGLPLFLGGFGALFAGWISPHLSALLGNTRTTRKGFGAVGFTLGAALLVISTYIKNPYVAVIAIALVSFCNDLMMPGAWAACMDVGGKYVGTLSGTMNMMGNLGGFVSPIVIGYIIQYTNNWNLTFYVTAAVYIAGAICWLATDPVTPLEEQTS